MHRGKALSPHEEKKTVPFSGRLVRLHERCPCRKTSGGDRLPDARGKPVASHGPCADPFQAPTRQALISMSNSNANGR